MNRCIQCQRCVRFYREYAGGHDFECVPACGTRVYFGRDEDGVLENEFSGNLVEICPTGVFTDATLKQPLHAKVGSADGAFDLRALRCWLQHHGGRALRHAAPRRESLQRHEVNGYFLCDRGRFGYEFVNSEQRIREPLVAGERLRSNRKRCSSS